MKKPEPSARPLPAARPAIMARPAMSARPISRAPLAAYAAAPDPLTEPPEGTDPQEAVEKELGELESGFRSRMKDEAERFKSATSGGYYFVAAFESAEQCDSFLRSVGMPVGNGDLFLDGRLLADKLSIKLPVMANPPTYTPKQDRRLSPLVRRPVAR